MTDLNFTPPTATDVVAEVRRIAAETPDFIYRPEGAPDNYPYVYVADGEGSCIIGRALISLGVPVTFFDTPFPGLVADKATINSKAIGCVVASLLNWPITREVSWLAIAQQAQDRDVAWAEAVAIADRRVPLS